MAFVSKTVTICILSFLDGVYEFVRIDRFLKYCARDASILGKIWSIAFLNFGILYGSSVLEHSLLSHFSKVADKQAPDLIFHHTLYHGCFLILWLWPAYIAVLISCSVWYSTLAERAAMVFQKHAQEKVSEKHRVVMPTPKSPIQIHSDPKHPLRGLAEGIYRSIFVALVFLAGSSLDMMPYSALFLGKIVMAWSYSYYCFDYQWSLHGISLQNRRHLIERNWPFFIGFGIPMVIVVIPGADWVLKSAYISTVFCIGVIQSVEISPSKQLQLVCQREGVTPVQLPSNPVLTVPAVVLQFLRRRLSPV